MHIETERLRVDDIRPEDRTDYFTNISHDKEMQKTFICNYAEDLEMFDFNRFVGRNDLFGIRTKADGRLIGVFVECEINEKEKSLEIGYGMGVSHWGKGYMTEVVRAMLSYYLGERGFRTVYASFFPENTASKHVMEKCGMTYSHCRDKELTYLGVERDLIYYKISKKET